MGRLGYDSQSRLVIGKDEETDSVSSIQSTSNEVNSSSTACLSDNLEEEMLSESTDLSISSDEDEELTADSPTEKAVSESSYSSQSSHSFVVQDDQEEAQTNTEANFSEKARPATSQPVDHEQILTNHSGRPSTFGSSLEFGFMEGNLGTSEANFHSYGKSNSHPTLTEERVTDVKPNVMITPLVPLAYERCYSTVKFQGEDIRAELMPTLETIWAKHGNLIGENTVHSKTILASALEELAELIITLNNTTGRTLTDSQADDFRSNVLDFQRQGIKVEWLMPIIDKAVILQKNKSLIESIMALDKEIAEVDEKEREFLAQSAKLKKELKVNRACLCSRVSLTEMIEDVDLDDFLGNGLW